MVTSSFIIVHLSLMCVILPACAQVSTMQDRAKLYPDLTPTAPSIKLKVDSIDYIRYCCVDSERYQDEPNIKISSRYILKEMVNSFNNSKCISLHISGASGWIDVHYKRPSNVEDDQERLYMIIGWPNGCFGTGFYNFLGRLEGEEVRMTKRAVRHVANKVKTISIADFKHYTTKRDVLKILQVLSTIDRKYFSIQKGGIWCETTLNLRNGKKLVIPFLLAGDMTDTATLKMLPAPFKDYILFKQKRHNEYLHKMHQEEQARTQKHSP